jgi:3-hydroxyisobutyrate dehydrogenase-like beta-hydroxyacid dehydrogenase
MEAATHSDVLIVCLLDHGATQDAVMSSAVGNALSGKVLVQLSTTTEDEVRDLEKWTNVNGIRLMKGAILVTPADIKKGNGAVLYGGDQDLYNELLPILNAMGGNPTHVSNQPPNVVAPANASYSFLYAALISFLYGAAICRKRNVSVETFTKDIIEPFISSGSLMAYLSTSADAAAKRNYGGDLQATLNVWNEGLEQIMTDIESFGIDTSILKPLKELMDKTSAQGHANSDIAAIIETLLEGESIR